MKLFFNSESGIIIYNEKWFVVRSVSSPFSFFPIQRAAGFEQNLSS